MTRRHWRVVFTKQAQKEAARIVEAGLRDNAEKLLRVLAKDPFATPPRFEKLLGDLAGAYSHRITIQHRLVYQGLEDSHTVKVLRMWTHHE